MNTGSKTVAVAPSTIPTKGSSIAPFAKSAKISLPKYLLIKKFITMIKKSYF